MAIPITCPGCKAAFEVPDTLAGKTIRCTSCKTQLTVDTPASATAAATTSAATDSKKPFGWAGKSSATTPTAKPEPLPLDDDTPVPSKPVAKTSPNGKPVVKSDVTVDDDEEDEKTSPAKKPVAKAAAAKTASKTRDDDDDDDDYEPAAKNRKNQGGSGAMIALIGGGLLALGAIVGLSIWLLSGDDKKPDTASSNNSTPASDPSKMGGRPMPGGGGGPRPGGGDGGGSPVNAGGWQTFTTDGFTAELPGTATEDNGSFLGAGAGNVPPDAGLKAYVLKNGVDTGFFVVRMNLPAEASNLPAQQLLDQIARGAEQGGGFGGRSNVGVGAKTDITQDGFSGKQLQLIDTRGGNGGGVMRIVLAGTKLYMYGGASDNFASMRSDTDRFIASVKITAAGGGIAMGGPNDPTRPPMYGGGAGGPMYGGGMSPRPGSGQGSGVFVPPQPGGAGGPMYGGGVSPPPNGIPLPSSPMPGGGGFVPPTMPGVDNPFPMPGGGNPFPMPGIGEPGGGRPQIPPPNGGGVQPGGIPQIRPGAGGIGQPGGGQPFPGVGGNQTGDTGKLASRVSEHVVAVFDGEKKELITISYRNDKGKVAGELRRYGYPSFKLEGTVRIPSLATRAVLDAKTQLLYVTTAATTSTQVLGPERFDRPAVAGSIAVYDLGMLRAGKVEEQSDFRAAGTVSLGAGRVIRDLVLSEDGKTLYALTGAVKGKSQLAAIDTTERKVTKTKDLPNAAWEMYLRPSDGKLLVSYLPSNPGTAAGIGVIDPAALTIASTLPLQKGFAYHAAVAKDGRIVVSVPSDGASSPLSLELIEGDKQNTPAIKAATAAGQSNNGYVALTPNGKFLIASSHHPEKTGGGMDVYETSDSSMGEKKVSSMKKAGDLTVGGSFLVSPDSEYVVFGTGAVLKLDDLGTTGNGGGFGGGVGENPGGNPFPPLGGGVVNPGGGVPLPGGIGNPGGVPGRPPGSPMPPGGVGNPGGVPGRPPGSPMPGGVGMPPGGVVQPVNPGGVPGMPPGMPVRPGDPAAPPAGPGGAAPGGVLGPVVPGGVVPPGGMPVRPGDPGKPGGPAPPPGGVPAPGGVGALGVPNPVAPIV